MSFTSIASAGKQMVSIWLCMELVGAPGFEPEGLLRPRQTKECYLLARLALYCVTVHGFGSCLSDLDPSWTQVGGG